MRIIVLGAGVIGVTSAWALAKAGHSVTVIERRAAAGMETSFGNGGQVAAGHAEPWAHPAVLGRVLAWMGRESAPLRVRLRADPAQWRWALGFLRECLPGRHARTTRTLAALAAYSRDRLEALTAETGIEYARLARGILHLCATPASFETQARHAEAMRAFGIEREVMSRAECLALEPALAASRTPIAGGIHTPRDVSGDAHLFTQGLAQRAAAQGVVFRYDAELAALEVSSQGTVAGRLRNGEVVQAEAWVVALGSFSAPMLAPLGIRIPVYPLKGYSVTLPLSGTARDAAPTMSLSDESHKIVISRFGDRLRAAGTAELAGWDTDVDAARCDAIRARVCAFFPALAQTGEAVHWAGLRPATPSNAPLIGRTRIPGLWLNTGHGTLGWTLACGSAFALADLIDGERPTVDYPFA
ncbi:MAG TPA: D-amino acid dehydrogenase [Burkholderiales bacterium]